MEMSQKREAAREKAAASQSRAIMWVPSEEWMPSLLRVELRAATTAAKRTVEVTAERMVKRVAALDSWVSASECRDRVAGIPRR
jgi:hypothetical protein